MFHQEPAQDAADQAYGGRNHDAQLHEELFRAFSCNMDGRGIGSSNTGERRSYGGLPCQSFCAKLLNSDF
jgi:hypothetical protein